jgi:hypothetical protein
MKLVVTVMVRDEIDIIAPMIEHHLAQGADLIIVTDNGSVDGTAEALQDYAALGLVELHHDPVHRKQQHSVVTQMARRAYTVHGADWVINADADEFWAAVDKSLTMRQALESIPTALNAFTAPVTNMVGPPAVRGGGVDRLLWRDHRTTEQLQDIGIFAQPTDNAVHRGDPEVVVAQGNHFVSLHSRGAPAPEFALEVLHLPWRSWGQFEAKVVNAGRGYEASPDLRPSKNHHGMADFRRYQAGRLESAYLLRQPLLDGLAEGQLQGFFDKDTWLRDYLHGLVPNAAVASRLSEALEAPDEPFDAEQHRQSAALGRQFRELEAERDATGKRADDLALVIRDLQRQLATRTQPTSLRADVARTSRRIYKGARRRLRKLT